MNEIYLGNYLGTINNERVFEVHDSTTHTSLSIDYCRWHLKNEILTSLLEYSSISQHRRLSDSKISTAKIRICNLLTVLAMMGIGV